MEEFRAGNKPHFRIVVWEAKDLEALTAEAHSLRAKYNLPDELPFVALLNRYHLEYVVKPQLNTVEFLFRLMDLLDQTTRDRAFAPTYHDMINPRYRTPTSGDQTLEELRVDRVDYESFKRKCLDLSILEGAGFVHRVISEALSWMFHLGDKSMTNTFVQRNRFLSQYATEKASTAVDSDEKQAHLKVAERAIQANGQIPGQIQQAYDDYLYICHNLIRKLLSESGAP